MSFNWLSPKAKTRESSISGKGTVAKEPIKKDELIAVFGGYAIDFSAWERLSENVKFEDLQIHDNLLIGPTKLEDVGEGDYVNHSCEPNAGIKGQIFLVAMKDIRKNEEITFDYATTVSIPTFRIKCNCKSANCRRVITGEDWKNPKLQKKYKGYFSYYLQQKIDDLNVNKKTS